MIENKYVITEGQIERYEKGCTFNLKHDVMQQPFSAELQKERERVLNIIMERMNDHWYEEKGGLKGMYKDIIEPMLRGEP